MTDFESGEQIHGEIHFSKKEDDTNSPELEGTPESEPGIANPELAELRVELPETATFNDLVDYARFEFGDDAADKVLAEIQFQTQQEDGFSLSMKILDLRTLYETPEDAQYWLPVIFG
jgi:hypothetical protein